MAQKQKLNAGLNAIRDFLGSDIQELAVGRHADVSKTDTALDTEVRREAAGETDGGIGEVTHTIRLETTEANGEALDAVATVDGGGNLQDIITFAEETKTTDFEIEFAVTSRVVNP